MKKELLRLIEKIEDEKAIKRIYKCVIGVIGTINNEKSSS